MRVNFYFNNFENKGINKETKENIIIKGEDFINCFFNCNYLYICFYIYYYLALNIWVFDPVTRHSETRVICTFLSIMDIQRFYKGIHLKDDIVFFIFFKGDGVEPYFSIYQIYSNKIPEIFKSYYEIIIPGSYINNAECNDLIKLNDNMVCFVGTSSDRKKINILTFFFIPIMNI